ncbi:MAG: hypothetical protein HY722_15960 [Planctomycetes bacterium]|nr:hypothetical protein [Planctomycetota bacterium]
MENLILGEGVRYLAAPEGLTGSAARRLGDALCAAASEGCRAVVLDLGECRSIDSLGVDALARGLDAGLGLALAVGAFFDFSTELLHLCMNRRGISVHYAFDQALARSGVQGALDGISRGGPARRRRPHVVRPSA